MSAGALSLAACASTPEAIVRYFPAKTDVTATVTQSLTCTPTFSQVISSNKVDYTVVNTADYLPVPYEINVSELDGNLKNGNVSIKLYDDGRLKSINADVKGQGGEIIKSATTLIGSVFGLGGGIDGLFSANSALKNKDYYNVCAVINRANPKKTDGIVSLIYNGSVVPKSANTDDIGLKLTESSALLATLLNHAAAKDAAFRRDGNDILVGGASIVIQDFNHIANAVENKTQAHDEVMTIKLRSVSELKVTPIITFSGLQEALPTSSHMIAGLNMKDRAGVKGTEYEIPISKNILFGKNEFTLEVSEFGTIQAITYNTTSGTADSLGGVNTASGLVKSKSETAKEEADRIVQEQRLLRCKADLANCV